MKRLPNIACCLVASLFFTTSCASEEPHSAREASVVQYGEAQQLAVIDNDEIDESSGLACSIGLPDAFWTHNDSGDVPRLFLIDRGGKTLATLNVAGAKAIDWEDMCSFARGGVNYLLIGDVGNNPPRREELTLYLLREPRFARGDTLPSNPLRVERTIRFRYEDGAVDCEAVAVDAGQNRVYLIAKQLAQGGAVYELPLSEKDGDHTLVARRIAKIDVALVTALDISPDGRRAIVGTYLDAFEFTRTGDQTWSEVFAGSGRHIPLPTRPQGESICYGADGKSLYLTSERARQPLWEVPALPSDKP